MNDIQRSLASNKIQEPEKHLTKEQDRVYGMAMEGRNLFITGGPGTGKSFLTKKVIAGFEENEKSVLVMAPTGIAAINVGGTTIHRGLGLTRGEIIKDGKVIRGKKCPLLDKTDVVVIDEISMARMDLFEYIIKCIRSSEKRTGNRIQLIVIGDFFQLPPVMIPESKELLERYYGAPVGRGYCFQSKEWDVFGFDSVILKEVIRQSDKQFINALNQLRYGEKSCLKYLNTLPEEDFRFPYLVPTNKVADGINQRKLEELAVKFCNRGFECEMRTEGNVSDSDLVVPRQIVLYPGTRVMMVVNDPAGRFQNGSCGVTEEFHRIGSESVEVVVRLDNGKRVWIQPYTWKVTRPEIGDDGTITQEECGSYTQLPMKFAYAITIHKSQGQTYDAININPDCWEAAQLYVSLSRVRSPQGVHLTKRISTSSVIVDSSVVEFYQKLESQEVGFDVTERVKDIDATWDDGNLEQEDIKETEPEIVLIEEETKPKKIGRPTPFAKGTKRIRVGVDEADYIQEICKKRAVSGGQIRLLPDEVDICISDLLDADTDFSQVTIMAIPIELEGLIRREIKNYEKRRF